MNTNLATSLATNYYSLSIKALASPSLELKLLTLWLTEVHLLTNGVWICQSGSDRVQNGGSVVVDERGAIVADGSRHTLADMFESVLDLGDGGVIVDLNLDLPARRLVGDIIGV